MDPFLPDLDPEPETEGASVHRINDGMAQRGYEVGSPRLASSGMLSDEGDEEEEGMAGSALFPGSDIF